MTDQIIGQDRTIDVLRDLLQDGKFPASFLISGPRGSGKKTLAKVIACALNCEFQHFNEKCSCDACRKIKLSLHPDVRWYGLDEEVYSIGIDEIHDLIHWASYKVLEGKKNIFVVNTAERMTEEAANALLKTLEEPPEDSILLLLVENPANLRSTLLSRCFKIKVQPIPYQVLREILVEQFKWDEKQATLAAKCSRGALGQALAFKEENFPGLRKQFLEDILPNPVGGLENWIGKKRHEILRYLQYLALLLRDLAVYRETGNDRLLYHEDFEAGFKMWSGRLKTEILLEIIQLIDETRTAIQDNANPKIALFRLGAAITGIYEKNLLPDNTPVLR